MKVKKSSLYIGLILAAIATVLVILLPHSANLWVAYGFCLAGIALMVGGVFAIKKDNIPGSYAQLQQSAWFLPWSLGLSIIVLLLQAFNVFTLPTVWHIVLQAILLAVAAIKLIGVGAGKNYIEATDQRVKRETGKIAALVNEAMALQGMAASLPDDQRAAAAAAAKQLAEALRYSDPMSNDAVAELDAQIAAKVQQLRALCTPEESAAFIAECGALCADIRNRNNILRSSK